MKGVFTFWLGVFLLLTYGHASAQTSVKPKSIQPAQARDHVGDTVTVCGMVSETFYNERGRGRPTYINFGGSYPNQVFTAVVWAKDVHLFDYTPYSYLKQKNVCVTGQVGLYKATPQILLHSGEQVVIQ